MEKITVHTIEKYQNTDIFVIVCLDEYSDFMKFLVEKFNCPKKLKILACSNCGQFSIFNRLSALINISDNNSDTFLIHDGYL